MENQIKAITLRNGDIFTLDTKTYIRCLVSNQIDVSKFKPIRLCTRRLIPKQWYKKLMFWQWIKMVDLVDIEFIGN